MSLLNTVMNLRVL